MLGQILQGLTDATQAEAMLATVANPLMRDRIEHAATAAGVAVGALISGKLRHVLDHADEELWLDLLGAMANTPDPAAVAVDRILARTFPDPVRVRISRTAA